MQKIFNLQEHKNVFVRPKRGKLFVKWNHFKGFVAIIFIVILNKSALLSCYQSYCPPKVNDSILEFEFMFIVLGLGVANSSLWSQQSVWSVYHRAEILYVNLQHLLPQINNWSTFKSIWSIRNAPKVAALAAASQLADEGNSWAHSNTFGKYNSILHNIYKHEAKVWNDRNSPSMQEISPELSAKFLIKCCFFLISWPESQRCRAEHITWTTLWGISTISSPLERYQITTRVVIILSKKTKHQQAGSHTNVIVFVSF